MNDDAPIAVLPMYDWDVVRPQTDQLWREIRDNLAANGIAAPRQLDRESDIVMAWESDNLVLGQTCGLPYIRDLRGKVHLVGTPDYAIPNCPNGWYNSVIIVRKNDGRSTLADYKNSRMAANSPESQSGFLAMMYHIADLTTGARFFETILLSGGHAASIAMVADGVADIAAIDHVSWRLAQKNETATEGLRVLECTIPTPGLPYICAKNQNQKLIAKAVQAAIEGLPADIKTALGIRGFWASTPQEYAIIAKRAELASRVSRLHGF
ncbi:MAG: PhnD/SsuA/transferrin family substrate-binding protein [Paracoccaceae bacterium]